MIDSNVGLGELLGLRPSNASRDLRRVHRVRGLEGLRAVRVDGDVGRDARAAVIRVVRQSASPNIGAPLAAVRRCTARALRTTKVVLSPLTLHPLQSLLPPQALLLELLSLLVSPHRDVMLHATQ